MILPNTENPKTEKLTELYNRLGKGTLWLNAFFLLGAACWFPKDFLYLAFGMGLGAFYLVSLMFTVQHPKPKIQFVFSLTRLALLAYVMVNLAKFNIHDTSVVIFGFLSYKIVLVGEYLSQIWVGLLWQKQHRTPQS